MTDLYNLTNMTESYGGYELFKNVNDLTGQFLFMALLIVLWIIIFVNKNNDDTVMALTSASFIVTIIAVFGVSLSLFKLDYLVMLIIADMLLIFFSYINK